MAVTKINVDRLVAVDEFEKDEVFYLAHLIFTPKQVQVAVKRWTRLQKKIKQRLLQRGITVHKKLTGDQLPEIHAEWLVQSGEYYRWDGATDKQYWKEHLDWLDEAMQIIRHVHPVVHYGHLIDHRKHELKKLKDAEIYENSELRENMGMTAYSNFISIVLNPYTKAFCYSLASLERMFYEKRHSYEIICDDYDQCKGFSTLKIFKELHDHGITASGVVPQFLSSEDEILIQMADVCAYAGGQVTWANRRRQEKPDFSPNEKIRRVIDGQQKYILPIDGEFGASPPPRGPAIDALSRPIFMDLIVDYVGGRPDLREALLNARNDVVEALRGNPK